MRKPEELSKIAINVAAADATDNLGATAALFDAKFAALVAQDVLDHLVAVGVLGADGTAYRQVAEHFSYPAKS